MAKFFMFSQVLSVYSEARQNVENGFAMKPWILLGFIVFAIVCIVVAVLGMVLQYKQFQARRDAELIHASATKLAAQAQFSHATQKDADSINAAALRMAMAKIKSPEDALAVVESAEHQAHQQLNHSSLFDDSFTINSHEDFDALIDQMAMEATANLQNNNNNGFIE